MLTHEENGPAARQDDADLLARCQQNLEDEGFPAEKARQYVENLLGIMKLCVEMGFSVELCGQFIDPFIDLPKSDGEGVDSSPDNTLEHENTERGGTHGD